MRVVTCSIVALLCAITVFAESPVVPTPVMPDSSKPRVPAVPVKKAAKKKAGLDSAKVYKAEQVVVTGTRNETLLKDSPVRVEVVDNAQLKNTAMVTLGDMLKEQTGLSVAPGSIRQGVQMMGLGADYTLIMVDGQPLTGRVAGVLDLTRISVGNIERVEIVKGPMSSLYGSDALAGVINIITRKPNNGWGARVYSQYLQKGASELQTELNYGGDNVDVASYINLKHSGQFTVSNDSVSVPYSGFDDYTVQSRWKYYALSNLSLSANVRAFGSRSKGTFIESVANQIAQNTGSVETTDRSLTLGCDWTHGKARLSSQLYGTMYNETYNFDVEQGSAGRTDNYERRTFRWFLQYDVLWNDKNRFTFGGEFLYDDANGTRYPENPLYRTGALFGQWEGNPTDWISYALSLRYDNNSAFGTPESHFFSELGANKVPVLPRLSLNIKPLDNCRIYATAGEGFKAPDFRQLYVNFSNRLAGAGYDLIGARILGLTLLPEQSTSYDVGCLYIFEQFKFLSLPTQISIDAHAFRNNLHNLIEYYKPTFNPPPPRDVYSYQNISRVYTQGIEATVKYAVEADSTWRVSGQVGYQYLDANNTEVKEAIDAGTAGYVNIKEGRYVNLTHSMYGGLWFRSRHSGNIRVQYDNLENAFSVTARAQYVGKYGDPALESIGPIYIGSNSAGDLLDNPSEYVAAYTLVHLSASKNIEAEFIAPNAKLACTIGINNLLGVSNPQYVPSLIGRQFFVNASFNW